MSKLFYQNIEAFKLRYNTEVLVIEEPVGWDNAPLIIERDKKTHGFTFKYTDGEQKLEFTRGQGYELIKSAYEAEGNDAMIEISFKFDDQDDFLFYGKLDLNTYGLDEDAISCTIIESNEFRDLLSSRNETKINLLSETTLDNVIVPPGSTTDVILYSKAIQKGVKMVPGDLNTSNTSFILVTGVINDVLPGFIEHQYEEIQESPSYTTQVYNGFYILANDVYMLKVVDPGNYNIKASLVFNSNINISAAPLFGGDATTKFRVIHKTFTNVRGTTHEIDVQEIEVDRNLIGITNVVQDFTIDFERQYDELEADDRIYIWQTLQVLVDDGLPSQYTYSGTRTYYANAFIEINALTTYPETSVSGFRFFEAFDKCIERITNQSNRFESNFFGSAVDGYVANGCGSKYIITNGFQLRNYNKNEKPTLISFKELFEGASAIFGLGMHIRPDDDGDKVIIEKAENYYHNKEIIVLTAPSNYVKTVNRDRIFNKINIGYSKYEDENENSADEFNTERLYQLPIKSIQNELTIKSSFIASGYAIENTRRLQFYENPTESWKYDDDLFIITLTFDTKNINVIFFDDPQRIFFLGVIKKIEIGDTFIIEGSALGKNGTYTCTGNYFSPNGTYVLIEETISASSLENLNVKFGFVERVPESNQPFSLLENAISPETIYNARITPARMLMNHAKFINSGLRYKRPADIIKNTFTKQNGLFKTQFRIGETCLLGDSSRLIIQENQDFYLNDFDKFKKIFSPEIITFEHVIDYETILYLERCFRGYSDDSNDNFGYISVIDPEGVKQSGYLMKLQYDPNTEIATITLECKAPDQIEDEIEYETTE